MERHFILPLTIAAALHAGLLFGFRRHAVELPPLVKNVIRWTPASPLAPEPPPPPEPEEVATAPKSAVSDPPPSLVERPTVLSPTDFPVPIPDHPPSTLVNVTTIPGGPVGPPGVDISSFGGPGPLSFKDLDNVPRARSQMGPTYPSEARRDGRGGEVMVEFTVDETGAVHDPRAVKSTDRIFEEPALRAVARWRFEPGLRNGRAVRFRMVVPIVFSLAEN
jgi:protein TonB